MHIVFIGDASYQHTRNWTRDLACRGHRVTVLTFFRGDIEGVEVVTVPLRARGKLAYVVAIPRTRRLIRRLQPDVLIAYYVTSHGLVGATAGRHPLILCTSGDDIMVTPWESRAMRATVSWSLRRADVVTAWGQAMAESAVRLGVPTERVFMQPRGVDLKQIPPPESPPFPDGPLRVISTRQLAWDYYVDVTVRGVAELTASRPARLDIFDKGPEARALRDLAQTLGLDAVFHGRQPQSTVFAALRRSDIYVSSSRSDGVSNALLEAMACGALPVATDIAANREWITHGENGLLFPVGDVAALAACLRRAADDPAWRDRARIENRARVEAGASWDVNMARFNALCCYLGNGMPAVDAIRSAKRFKQAQE